MLHAAMPNRNAVPLMVRTRESMIKAPLHTATFRMVDFRNAAVPAGKVVIAVNGSCASVKLTSPTRYSRK